MESEQRHPLNVLLNNSKQDNSLALKPQNVTISIHFGVLVYRRLPKMAYQQGSATSGAGV